MRTFALILFCYLPQFSFAQKTFTIPSTNNLLLDANMYQAKNANSKAPLKVMLLCHQARYSKGEYVETAPQFAKMGYTCIAISQRSGDSVNGVVNTTARAARAKNLPTEYIDAEQDIISALNFVFSKYKQPIILVGSSYSSSLILKIAKQFPEKVKATISFSPGEYFADSTIITKSLEAIRMPVYITCSKEEIQETQNLFVPATHTNITFFKPIQEGKHGSKALWKNNNSNAAYWKSLKDFLKKIN